MFPTRKSDRYALRAVLELAKSPLGKPRKSGSIAQAQAIPPRFLEVILNQLKGSGLVASKRGYQGGYFLLRKPEDVTVGDVLRFLHGTDDFTHQIACRSKKECPFDCDCAFAPLWKKVSDAIFHIYDATTFADLLTQTDQLMLNKTTSCLKIKG